MLTLGHVPDIFVVPDVAGGQLGHVSGRSSNVRRSYIHAYNDLV